MLRPSLIALVILAATLLLPTTAPAIDIAPTLNYQGRLTDAAANPVADGSYDLTFRVFDAVSGGTQLWSSGASPVSVIVANGNFSVILGGAGMDPLPENIFSGQMLFLEVQLDGEPAFSPRQPLVATPYSLRANFAEDAQNAQFLGGLDNSSFLSKTGGTLTGQLTLNIAGGGEEFVFSRNSTLGYASFVTYYDGAPKILMFGLDSGGQFTVADDNGHAQFNVSADPTFGGTLTLNDNEGGSGIYMVGGSASTQTVFELTPGGNSSFRVDASNADPQPKMLITDESGIPQIELDPGNPDPGSKVYLPAQSIDGYEIADEAVKSNHIHPTGLSVDNLGDDVGGSQNVFPETTEWFLTGNGPASIIAGGVMAPADGFVLAICSFQLDVLHVSGTKSEAVFGLSDDSPNLLGDQTHTYTRWPSFTSGTFGDIVSIQRIFPVEEGVNRIWLVGEKTSGVNPHIVTDVTMSVLYFKKDYSLGR